MTTPQAPFGSGFGAGTTAEEVMAGIDLAGTTAIVTGGYSGLGKETARVFRAAGAEVIVPARDIERAKAELAGIDVRIEPMDLMDPDSIDGFANRFLDSGRALHRIVTSAGIMANPLTRDARGFESQFSTNHLGHFQLVTSLLPALRKANGARVVSVSSWGHHYSPVHFEDPNFERREYGPWLGYGQSKTANVLFAVELDERERANGIRAFAVHPGGILETNLGKYLSSERLRALGVIDEDGNPIIDPSRNLKNVRQGASTQVWAAVSPQLEGMGGVYCENCDIAELEAAVDDAGGLTDVGTHQGVMPYAVDSALAGRLWSLSEELTARG